MNRKMSLPELYAKRDRNNAYVAKLSQRQHALGDRIKADEKLLASYTRQQRTHRLCSRAGLLESRREKFHHPLQHDRYVRWGGAAAVLWCALRRVACH